MEAMKKSLIVGHHPISNDIERQLRLLGSDVEYGNLYEEGEGGKCIWDIIFLLANPEAVNAVDEDLKIMKLLEVLAERYGSSDKRPVVHLLLLDAVSLRILQMSDLPTVVNDNLEVYPFTLEDEWAKNIIVHLPGIKTDIYPFLDGKGISADSTQTVHAVVCGFGTQAEAIALHMALTAHFPNYRPDDKVPLRTRITIVDKEIEEKRDAFIAKYQNLFEHSFYRTVNLKKKNVDFHYPQYFGRRKDFVDVEWEFVDGSMNHPEMRKALENWLESGKRIVSIFVAHVEDGECLQECLSLPQAVYERQVPVFVRQRQSPLIEMLCKRHQYSNVFVFGMHDCGYDVRQPLWKMARMLKYFYDCSYGNIGVPTELPMAQIEESWHREKSFKIRFSNLYNVMTISVKMRSLGHDDSDAGTFYALTQKEIELLAETEHNRWVVERLLQGTRPCTDAELEAIRQDVKVRKREFKNRDIHFDLRAFDELEDDGTGKNAKVYDYDLTACIPLMVTTFYEHNENLGL